MEELRQRVSAKTEKLKRYSNWVKPFTKYKLLRINQEIQSRNCQKMEKTLYYPRVTQRAEYGKRRAREAQSTGGPEHFIPKYFIDLNNFTLHFSFAFFNDGMKYVDVSLIISANLRLT